MNKISKVIARQVFDSRGNPTIEAEVFSKNISSKAICPSGASTGTYEAFEKRDFGNKKYLGKRGARSVARHILKIILRKAPLRYIIKRVTKSAIGDVKVSHTYDSQAITPLLPVRCYF